MGLEVGSTIASLVASNPLPGDLVSLGDDHIRLLKTVLKNTFPGVGGSGLASPIDATEDELNALVGVTGLIANAIVPVGGIILWTGGTLPDSWKLCDGTSGTPDLRDKFIIGSSSTHILGSTGGSADAINVAHTHTVPDHTHTLTDPGHQHTITVDGTNENGNTDPFGTGGGTIEVNDFSFSTNSSTTGISANNATGLVTASSGASGTNANLPPFYALAYIMRVA